MYFSEELKSGIPKNDLNQNPNTDPNKNLKTESSYFFNVALIEPEIPQNVGNIGRTCVGTRTQLHLVGNLGFKITDANLKRAGLDYWQHLWWKHHESMQDWNQQISDQSRVFYFSTKSKKSYFDVDFKQGDCFVFGKETKGLSDDLMRQNQERVLTIPQFGPVRSLNVATSVAIVLYEAIRQNRINLL